jgi:thymidylate synthase (FAD)
MQIKLLSYTQNPIDTIYLACRQCYYPDSIQNLDLSLILEEDKIKLINQVTESGHTSVLEHVYFTFSISGVSRSLSHQLVRHRLASYSQQSQRYCDSYSNPVIMPTTIKRNSEAKELFEHYVLIMQETYKGLQELGIPNEDARSVLGNCVGTNLVMTMNIRSLMNFFEERCCTCAQREIRTLANKLLEECRKILPGIFKNFGAKCFKLGYCNESKKRHCGVKPHKSDFFNK